MSEALKIGDIVELRSGSPLMTVTQVDTICSGEISCKWFAKDDVKYDSFPVNALKRADAGG